MLWQNTIPRILLQKPGGCYETSQNTNGMLFLYPSEDAQVGLYILYENVHVHFIRDAEKKQKMHVEFACLYLML